MALEAIIGVVAVVASVASTAYSVYSSTEARHEARTEKHIAERAASLGAERATGVATLQAQRTKQAEENRRRRVLSMQRSIYGASGLEMEGSPLLVQAETIRNSEENLRQIEENRMLESAGIQENRALQSAGLAMNLKAEETATYNTAISSGMKGISTGYNIGRTYDWW